MIPANITNVPLILVRGLPHSGKSMIARTIASQVPNAEVIEFQQVWDNNLDKLGALGIGEPHKQYRYTLEDLLIAAQESMMHGAVPVIVHNFARMGELAMFIKPAKAALIVDVLIVADNVRKLDAGQLARQKRIQAQYQALSFYPPITLAPLTVLRNPSDNTIAIHYAQFTATTETQP